MPCPKCGSNNITTNNKGYGIGKGIIGAAIFGPLGLIAGNIGRHDIICTCLNCGHTWNLKKQIEENNYRNITQQEKTIDYKYDSKNWEIAVRFVVKKNIMIKNFVPIALLIIN